MPKTPKWLGNMSEKLYKSMYHSVTVSETEYLTPTLKRVRFNGDFSKVSFVAGNVIEFRITDTEFRHYTLSDFNQLGNYCETIFYLHGKGIGSRWANTLKTGDNIKLIGPGGSLKYKPEYARHVIFGDETCIGLMACMEKAIVANDQSLISIVEMNEKHEEWEHFAGEYAVFVPASFDNPATSAIALMNRDDFLHSTEDLFFYLTGRVKSIRAVKEFLITKGISLKQMKISAYWNEGKKGL
jgi:Siderophore-interacting protein